MNGSGLHGGGGAVGGYVQSQGWEFVPCSRMERADRGRGKARNPLRRVSSPPTVFSQIYEPQFDASSDGGECEAGAQFKIVRGQMWPSPESQQQQTPHSRLKKKFDDLKKRHVQDKEEWTREKESLLREVADIQVIRNNYPLTRRRAVYLCGPYMCFCGTSRMLPTVYSVQVCWSVWITKYSLACHFIGACGTKCE